VENPVENLVFGGNARDGSRTGSLKLLHFRPGTPKCSLSGILRTGLYTCWTPFLSQYHGNQSAKGC